MKFIEQKERFERMHQLIKLKATGTPRQFANKLGVSESTLYELLNTTKELGAEIKYCRLNQSYTYISPVRLTLGYTSLDLSQIKGGGSSLFSLLKNRSRLSYTCCAFK